MTEQYATPTGAPTPPPLPPAAPPPVPPTAPPRPPYASDFRGDVQGLRRSSDDRIVAGVCAGIAHRLGVDPVLVRVITAVLVFFAGAGVFLYVLGWLFLPEDRTGASVLDRAVGRRSGGSRTNAVLLALLLAVAAIVFAGTTFGGSFNGAVLVVLAVVAVVLLLRRDPQPPAPVVALAPGPVPGGAVAPPVGAPITSTPLTADTPTRPIPYAGPPQEDPTAVTTQIPTEPETAELPGTGTPWYATPPAPPGPPPVHRPVWDQVPPPPRPKERSRLFGLVVSAVLVAVGVLILADVNGADVPAAAYVALPLAVIGAGLLVGAWYGRSPGLMVLGSLTALALPVAVAVDEVDILEGERGDVTVDARTIAQGTGTHDYGAGEIRYDLSALDFTGRDETLRIDLGVGLIEVVLPPDVDVEVDGSVGVGSLRILDRSDNSGLGSSVSVRDLGDDGRGGGSLHLVLDAGIGDVEVSRATS